MVRRELRISIEYNFFVCIIKKKQLFGGGND